MAEPILPMRKRRILDVATSLMAHSPVVLLEGPRSVGKSTLLQEIARSSGAKLLDLDDLATRDAVRADPALAISGEEVVCIDEYQKAPVVLDAIKAELNKGAAPGRFVLTGSARHDSLPPAAQALTGRLSTLSIYPLSRGEQMGVQEDFLGTVLDDPLAVVTSKTSTTTRAEYIDPLCSGGFPLALASTASGRRNWFSNYVKLTLERDVREISAIRDQRKLNELLSRLAGQTAQVLNVDKAAHAVKLDSKTVDAHVGLLEKVFLLYRLEAWGKTLTARSAGKPKIHVLDSGIAAHLLRLTPEKLATLDPTARSELGHLVETFAVGELVKQASWYDTITGIGHWRDWDGNEVDLVIERQDGGILGFEVKTGSRVPGQDLKALIKLRDAVGDNFLGGFAVYLGARSYNYEDRIHVVPLDRLWTPTT
jgi:uncharacterized protein